MQRGLWDRPRWFALPEVASWHREALGVLVLALASGAASELARELASARLAVESSPWLEAARARGAPLMPHRLRNLVAPVGRALAARALLFAGGLVIVEKVLLLQGAGSLMWQAALQRDLPLAVGLAVLVALGLGLLRLALDLLVLWADPRLRDPA